MPANSADTTPVESKDIQDGPNKDSVCFCLLMSRGARNEELIRLLGERVVMTEASCSYD